MGIKTLSLFFIDEVAKYRQYDEDGNELLGEYGKIFEQEYLSVLNEHRTLFDPAYTAYLDSTDVHDVHKGYFSIDKKGHSVNSSVKRGSDMSDDISAYDLILKIRNVCCPLKSRPGSSSPTLPCGKAGITQMCSKSAP